MAWNDLKATVAAAIKTNGNQEITGARLQSTLNSIIDQVGANATFKGVATPSTAPGSPDGPIFYLAVEKGVYSNFSGQSVSDSDGLVILLYSSVWNKYSIPMATKKELDQLAGELNVINVSANDTDVIDFATAVIRVPENRRKRGSIVTYRDSTNNFRTMQYKGGNPLDINQWSNVNNWDEIIKQPTIDNAISAVYGKINTVNVSANDTDVIDLATAVSRVPENMRKRGSIVTYRDSTNNTFRQIQIVTGNPAIPVVWQDATNWKDIDEDINNVAMFNIAELRDFWSINTLESWNPDYVAADYDALISRYTMAIANNPIANIEATIEEIGRELSEYNLPLYKVEIKAKPQSYIPSQKKVVYISGLHGSEYANPFTLATFVEMMLSNDTDDTISALRDNFHWIIIPHANPWGFKTKKRSNHNGVNLNRNFPKGWIAQGEPGDWGDYSGTEPLSEIETQLVNEVITSNADYYLAIDGHSYSGWAELPYTMFWTHSQNSILDSQISYIGRTITKYLKNNFLSFANCNDNVARINSGVSSGNGELDSYFSDVSKTGYGTLLELAMRIYGAGVAGNKDIANANMICFVNIIKGIINTYPIK